MATCRTNTDGQLLPVTLSPDWTPEGLLNSVTCQIRHVGFAEVLMLQDFRIWQFV